MKINLRSEIGKDVQFRLNKGERKEDIYRELQAVYPKPHVIERSLAQWPYPEDKQKRKMDNAVLLAVWILLTVLKAVRDFGLLNGGGSTASLLFLSLVINLLIIYGLKNYNLISYLLVLLFGLRMFIGIRVLSFQSAIPLVLTLFAMVLAWRQKIHLFPNVSVLLRHKRDFNGDIIF